MSNGNVTAIALEGTDLIVGASQGIYRSSNNGQSWSEIDSGIRGNFINTIAVPPIGTGGSDLFAGISKLYPIPVYGTEVPGGGVYLSTNDGASWAPVDSGLPNTPVTCLAVKGEDIFAGTSSGIYVSTDNGAAWTQVDSGLTDHLINTLMVNGTSIFAGAYGGIYLSTNGGISWSPVSEGIINTSISALADFGTNLFAGDNGILLTTDGGNNWSTVDPNLLYVSAFAKSGADFYAAMRFSPRILRSTDDGKSWTLLDTGSTTDYFACLATSGADLFAGDAQSGNGIFLSTDNGANWTPVNSGLTNTWVYSLAVSTNSDGTTELFAGTQNGGLFLSTDNGRSWKVQSTDLSNEIVFSLVTLGTRLFAGTNSGVFVSTNNGANWREIGPQNATITSLAVAGTNLFAGGEYNAYSDGGVFLTTDYGSTWVADDSGLTNTDISALAVSDTNLYAGTYGSGTWRRPLSELITGIAPPPAGVPREFALSQNYPNPFNPSTVIDYQLPANSHVTLKVYDVLGREVRTLIDAREVAGTHSVTFDASSLSSGVYFYRLHAGSYIQTRKLVLLK